MKLLKQKRLVVYIVIILATGLVVGLYYHDKYGVKLNNGKITAGQDEIMFSTAGVTSGQSVEFWTDWEFIVLDEETYRKSYPGEDGLGISLPLPKELSNVKHTYQFTPKTDGEPVLHDEVFFGELPYSGSSDKPVHSMRLTTGPIKLPNDRAYVQISVTKEKHPLTMDTIREYGSIPFSSKIGGRKAAVGESVSENGAYENTYEAVIRDIDGRGANCYVAAGGMNRDYFLYLLQTLCGEKVKAPKIASAEKDEAVLAAGRKQIAIEAAAKEMIYDEYREGIESGKLNVFFMSEPYYIGETQTREGKPYNVRADYYIGRYRESGRRDSIETRKEIQKYLFVSE